MTRIIRMILAAGIVAVLAACASSGSTNTTSSAIPGVNGEVVYTQFNFWVADGQHEATNYRLGRLIPVNTKVRIESTTTSTIRATVLESGKTFTIINVPEYTRMNIRGIYDRYFSATPVNLDQFSAEAQKAIETAILERGMSKDAVLVARGYPPAHETPSLESDRWRYWQGMFNTIVVRFDNGHVSKIVN